MKFWLVGNIDNTVTKRSPNTSDVTALTCSAWIAVQVILTIPEHLAISVDRPHSCVPPQEPRGAGGMEPLKHQMDPNGTRMRLGFRNACYISLFFLQISGHSGSKHSKHMLIFLLLLWQVHLHFIEVNGRNIYIQLQGLLHLFMVKAKVSAAFLHVNQPVGK